VVRLYQIVTHATSFRPRGGNPDSNVILTKKENRKRVFIQFLTNDFSHYT
jgi:hypothetical protein